MAISWTPIGDDEDEDKKKLTNSETGSEFIPIENSTVSYSVIGGDTEQTPTQQEQQTPVEEVKVEEKKNVFQKVGSFLKKAVLGEDKEGDKRTDWERFQEEFVGFESKGGKQNREEVQQYYDNLKTGKEKADTAQEIQDLAKLKAYEILKADMDKTIEIYNKQNEEWDKNGQNPTIFGVKRESGESRAKMTETYSALKILESELGMTYISKGMMPEALKNIEKGFASGNAFNETGTTLFSGGISTQTLKAGAEIMNKASTDGWDKLTDDEKSTAMRYYADQVQKGKEGDKSIMDQILGTQYNSLGWGFAIAGSTALSGGSNLSSIPNVATGLAKVMQTTVVTALQTASIAPLYTSEIEKQYLSMTTPEYAYFVDQTGNMVVEKILDAKHEKGVKAENLAKLSNYLQLWSESWGEIIGVGADEVLSGLIKTKVFNGFANWARKTGKLAQGSLASILKTGKFDGVVGQWLEEELLNPIQSAIDKSQYQDPFFTKEGRERALIELVSFGMTGAGSAIQGFAQNKKKQNVIDTVNKNKSKFGLGEDKALDTEGNLYDVESGAIVVPKEEVFKTPELTADHPLADMLKTDFGITNEDTTTPPEQTDALETTTEPQQMLTAKGDLDIATFTPEEKKTLTNTLNEVQSALDLGAKKKVVNTDENMDTTISVEGTNIPEFIPEELRSRKYVQSAMDAIYEERVPAEGTKVWQVYQAILEQGKNNTVEDTAVTTQKTPKGTTLEEVKEVWSKTSGSDVFLRANEKIANAKTIEEVFDIIRADTSGNDGEATLSNFGLALDTYYNIKNRKAIIETPKVDTKPKEGKFALKVEKLRKDAPTYVTDLKVSDEAVNIAFEKLTGADIETKDIPVDLRVEVQKTLDAINSEMDKRIAEDTSLQVSMEDGFTREELAGYLVMDVLEDREYEAEMQKELITSKENDITEANLPFRKDIAGKQVLDSSKLKPMELQAIKAESRRMFGEENIKLMEQILTPDRQEALGKYVKAWIEIRGGQADTGGTYYHEAVHKALDIFLTPEEKRKLLDEVIRVYGKENLAKAWGNLSTDEKFRIGSYESNAMQEFVTNMDFVDNKTEIGIGEIIKKRDNLKNKGALLIEYANKYDIGVDDLWSSVVEITNKDTKEQFIYFVDGQTDAIHAQSLIDGSNIGLGGLVGDYYYHIRRLNENHLSPYANIGGKFDPSQLPYSTDASLRSKQREYRLQFGIAKTGNGKFRGVQGDMSVDAMAEEQLAEGLIGYVNNNPTTFIGKLKRMVDVFVDRWFRGIENIDSIQQFYESLVSGKLLARQQKIDAKQVKNFNKYISSIQGNGMRTDTAYRMELGKEIKKLTTKILKKLEGKTKVKKQFISDLTKQQDIKQVEKDIINDVLKKFPDDIDVATFEEKVLAELLPLERKTLQSDRWNEIALKDNERGTYDSYYENIYTSPIKVNAGDKHFGMNMGDYFGGYETELNEDQHIADHYFGHTRVEEFAGGVRRVIEVQSDLYQKGNLEKEKDVSYTAVTSIEWMRKSNLMSKKELTDYEEAKKLQTQSRFNKNLTPSDYLPTIIQTENLFKKRERENREGEVNRLSQYKDPTAHLRMIREEVRQASLDDKKVLLFPTGETGMKIEGLAKDNSWYSSLVSNAEGAGLEKEVLTSKDIKTGKIIYDQASYEWVITKDLGDGKFKAISKANYDLSSRMIVRKSPVSGDFYIVDKKNIEAFGLEAYPYKTKEEAQKVLKAKYHSLEDEGFIVKNSESFDINTKMDTSNPIFKFYEDIVGKYVKNTYQAQLFTDERDVSWWKIDIKPEYSQAVEAFRTDDLFDTNAVVEKLKAENGIKNDIDSVVSIKLPELIKMAQDLGASVKLQKSFRKAGKGGDFTAENGATTTDSRIRILRTLFDPSGEIVLDEEGKEVKLPETEQERRDRVQRIEQILAHEIGHMFDWYGGVGNMTLKRGNILGRIANLQGYIETEFRELENKDIRNELKALTQIWNPFDEETASKSYKNYRYNTKELYAEAISVMLNKPELLKEVAPHFYEAMGEYLSRKVEVRTELFKILDSIKEGKEIGERMDNMEKGFEEATGKRMSIDKRNEEYKKQMSWQKVITGVKMGFVNQYAPYLDKLRRGMKSQGITLSKLEEAEQLMGNLALKGNDAVKYAQDIQEQFMNPVSEAGIDLNTVGKIMVLERDLGDRIDLANPQGLIYDYAKETYEAVKKSMNPAQWSLLQEKLTWFRDYNFQLVEKGYKAGIYSKKFFEEIATVNKNTYTPFAVIKYIEDNYVSAGVIQATGTVSKVENPLTTQMLKSISIMRLTAINEAKTDVIKTFQESFAEDVIEADPIKDSDGKTIGWKKNAQAEAMGMTQMILMVDGKRTAFYIDKYVAGMFDSNQGGIGWEIARFITLPLRMVNRIFKPAVTVLKPSFQFYSNPLKDYQRSLTNLTALSGMFDKSNVALRTGKVFKAFTTEWIKNLKRSWDYAGNEMDSVTQKMLDMYVLSSNVKYEDIDIGNEKFSFDPVKKRVVFKGGKNWIEAVRNFGATVPVIKSTIVPVYDFYMRVGSMFEVNSKIAGFQYLRKQVGDEKASLYTRRYVGTPDYMQKGKFTPLMNELVVFSNVGIQAITADMNLALKPNTASGYWTSTAIKIVLPKLLMFLGATMLRVPIPDPDDPEKTKMVNPYDYLSEYYKAMYMAFPIGYNEESKSFVFFKMPNDEVGAVIGDLVWKMTTYLSGEGMKVEQLGSALMGLVPFTTGDNPLISIAKDWQQYLQGRNPYDDFRGRLAISTSKWNEGGMTRFGEMLKWTGNEMGVTNFSTYDNSLDTTLEKTMNLPLLERMFEVTNYGLTEREEFDKAQGKMEKSAGMDKLLKDYYAQPSDEMLLKKINEYVVSQKGEAPKDGWTGDDKAEETRLKSEFKRGVLVNSGNKDYTSIAKSGVDNDTKIEILDKQKKKMSSGEFKDFLSQVVKYEVVKGELFATYAKDKNLDQDTIYNVVKSSIPVLSADNNNTLIWEMRINDTMSNDTLKKLRDDGLITGLGYSKYIQMNQKTYDLRYNSTTKPTVEKKLF